MKILSTAILLAFIFISAAAQAQDTTQSYAFRNNKPYIPDNYDRPDPSEKLLQQFHLIKEANAGNPASQHKLGLQYLFGKGMKADTALAVLWIKKAAEQKFTPAVYNYGIILLKGIGVEWDPFAAFDEFLYAAEDGLVQAQYVLGLLYTDNLVVKRDLNTAYFWLKQASDEGFNPAKETIKEIAFKIDTTAVQVNAAENIHVIKSNAANDTLSKESSGNPIAFSVALDYIDFESMSDTAFTISETVLLEDLEKTGNPALIRQLYVTKPGSKNLVISSDSLDFSLLQKMADYGSPEALTFLGRMYEEGKRYRQDKIAALSCYIRATRFDSPRAPAFIDEIMNSGPMPEIKKRVNENDAEAMFVWHGLFSLDVNDEITEEHALDLLIKSAQLGYLPAEEELALSFFSGKIVKEDKLKAAALFKDAVLKGSRSAKTRLITSSVFSNEVIKQLSFIEDLKESEENGSLLSQVTLAYCFETGKGVTQNTGEAVKLYRAAAIRGSQYAFKELKRLYNSKRPDKSIFRL